MAGADRSPQKTRAAEPQIADLRYDASTVSSLESLPAPMPAASSSPPKGQEGVDKWLASLPDLSFMLSDKLAVPAA